MTGSIHGVSNNQDLEPGLIRRETRPFRYIIKDFVADYGAFVVLIFGIIVGIWPFLDGLPAINDLIFIFGFLFYLYSRNKFRSYQFKKPIEIEKGKTINDGIMFMGNVSPLFSSNIFSQVSEAGHQDWRS